MQTKSLGLYVCITYCQCGAVFVFLATAVWMSKNDGVVIESLKAFMYVKGRYYDARDRNKTSKRGKGGRSLLERTNEKDSLPKAQ